LIEALLEDTSLGIKHDIVLSRAESKGVGIEDIPNTCEKIVLVKKVWRSGVGMINANNWDELIESLHVLNKTLGFVDKIYKDLVVIPPEEIRDKHLSAVTAFYTFSYLNNLEHGLLLGDSYPPIINYSIKKQLSKSYMGIVYSLEYLWFVLLGEKQFKKSCVSKLHDAERIYSKKAIERLIDNPKTFLESFLLSETEQEIIPPNNINDFLNQEKIKERHKWQALDCFYMKIANELPILEKKFVVKFKPFNSIFAIKKPDKSIFGGLIDPRNLKNPNYLNNKDTVSIIKQLDYSFLWYRVNALDITSSSMFNGVRAFLPLLTGLVELNNTYRIRSKIPVRVYKHPRLSPNQCAYSYAVLVPAFGTWDYSGWLVFFAASTDYSGTGGSLYREAKEFIEKFEKEGRITVEMLTIEEPIFERYLLNKGISELELKGSKIDNFQNTLENIKGKFFEYISNRLFNENKTFGYSRTYCDFYVEGEQIDCIGMKKEVIDLFECKINTHWDDVIPTIRQIHRKNRILKNKYNKKVKSYLVTYNPVMESLRKRYKKECIYVIDNFKGKLRSDKIFTKSGSELIDIMDFNISKILNRAD
jgi:hypothetical protein